MVFAINSNYSITFDDVLLSPEYSSVKPKDVITSLNIGKIKLHIPIISAAMDTVTESKMAINMALNGGLGVIHRNMTIEKQVNEIKKVHTFKVNNKKYNRAITNSNNQIVVGASIGVENNAYIRLLELLKVGVDVVVIDVAHAHTETTVKFVDKIKKILKNTPLIVGNLATKKAARDLINAGVDAIKVGIGPGSICTTRVVTGVGIPQLSAVMDAYEASKKYNIPLIADGGIKTSGDIAKAIAGGASACMIGSLLAGTKESPGKLLTIKGKKYKSYRGMGSIGAMQKGSFDRYSQEETKNAKKLVAEGVEGMVPFKGNTEDVVYQLVGGLKSSMGYTGHKTIKQMQGNCKFIFITKAGARESDVHDVIT